MGLSMAIGRLCTASPGLAPEAQRTARVVPCLAARRRTDWYLTRRLTSHSKHSEPLGAADEQVGQFEGAGFNWYRSAVVTVQVRLAAASWVSGSA